MGGLFDADRLAKELEVAEEWLHEVAADNARDAVRQAAMGMKAIEKALAIAMRSGGIDEAHHKSWVIDQMVRALTRCPMVDYIGGDHRHASYKCQIQGASDEYIRWVRERCAGEDGPNTYQWDVGLPP